MVARKADPPTGDTPHRGTDRGTGQRGEVIRGPHPGGGGEWNRQIFTFVGEIE